MLSLIVSLLAAVLAAAALASVTAPGWGIFLGVAVFLGLMILLSRYFGKRLQAVAMTVQDRITEAQAEAQRLIGRFQTKPSSQKVMQAQVEKVMETGVIDALEILETAQSLYKWNILAERQINTLKMQLNFQIKRFDKADTLMTKILVLEPLTLAMKMTRQYHNEDFAALEKSFKKGVKKFKYDKALLIYSLYAWILIKRKKIDEALQILTRAKDKTDSFRLMGFGHRVYKNFDPRARIIKKAADEVLGPENTTRKRLGWQAAHAATLKEMAAARRELAQRPGLSKDSSPKAMTS